ncbi:MAG: fructosamine kinase family protein [Bacteroidetes Order II. Incertae sedis bacterium]|nr:fructosamine kinase family protein [Bacteroidetes Order II. bacterium]
MHPQQIKHLSSALSEPILAFSSLSGGDTAETWHIHTAHSTYFAKTGLTDISNTFVCEADGLSVLRGAKSGLVIPEIRALGSGFLVFEWLESISPTSADHAALGRGLAQLHQTANPQETLGYGYPAQNFIGRTPQHNEWHSSWPSFFTEHRLHAMAERCRRANHWSANWDGAINALCNALPQILPARPVASLLHGDLWHGNVYFTQNGPALIDPAVYYGHRETDLAMTSLFGGFSPVFYAAYHEIWPLETGYTERRDIYNLYHVLNHLLLFGSSYAGSVATILKKFG